MSIDHDQYRYVLVDLPDDDLDRAIATVTRNATDPDDARRLLEMCGLTPPKEQP